VSCKVNPFSLHNKLLGEGKSWELQMQIGRRFRSEYRNMLRSCSFLSVATSQRLSLIIMENLFVCKLQNTSGNMITAHAYF